jgi:toxin ParE1/3/4
VNVTIRPAARADLAEQVMFLVEKGGCDLGDRFVRAVKTTLEFLVSAPRLGRVWQSPNPMMEGIRSWPMNTFPHHLVFYRITSVGIEVVRVIHGARDIHKLLEE